METFTNYDISLNLPTSLEYIGSQAFMKSTKVKHDVYLPNLKYLGSGAFQFSGIVGFTFSNNLTYIGPQAVYLTNSLKNKLATFVASSVLWQGMKCAIL